MNGLHSGLVSSLQQISTCKRTTCLLDQPSIAKISKIDDGVAKLFEEDFNSLLRAVIVRGNKRDPSRPVDDRIRLQVRDDHVVQCLNDACSGGQRSNELAGG